MKGRLCCYHGAKGEGPIYRGLPGVLGGLSGLDKPQCSCSLASTSSFLFHFAGSLAALFSGFFTK